MLKTSSGELLCGRHALLRIEEGFKGSGTLWAGGGVCADCAPPVPVCAFNAVHTVNKIPSVALRGNVPVCGECAEAEP
jgi:hypothetical protein